MAKGPLNADQQTALDKEIELQYEDEVPGLPAKLSEKIIIGMEDEDVAMTVLRRLKGKKTSFLFELDEYEDMPSLLTLLRDEYGGGDFVIEGKRQNGQWAFKQGISVEAPIKKEDGATQSGAGDFQSVLLAMQDSARATADATRDLMVQMQTQQMKAQTDNMMMLVEMMKANKPEPVQQTSMSDMLAMMVSMKELNAAPAQENPMELFLKGMEMGKDVAGGDNDNLLQTAVKTFGAPLAQLANAQSEINVPPPEPAPQPTPLPAPQPALPVETAPTEPTSEDNPEMFEQLKLLKQWTPLLNTLLRAASIDASTEVYANLILDQVPEGDVTAFMGSDETYAKLYEFVPAAKQYRGWLDECRAVVLELLENADEAEDIPTSDVHEQPPSAHISDQTPPPVEGVVENT